MLFRAVVFGRHTEEEQQRARREVASQGAEGILSEAQRPVLWHFSSRSELDGSVTGPSHRATRTTGEADKHGKAPAAMGIHFMGPSSCLPMLLDPAILLLGNKERRGCSRHSSS